MNYQPDEQHSPLRSGIFTLLAVILMAGLVLSPLGMGQVFAGTPAQVPTPPAPNWSHLPGIFKTASKPFVALGGTLTYTIHLDIGSMMSFKADVTDPLPDGLDYVDGTASNGAVYDSATRTLTWTGLSVGGPALNLTFDVKDSATVTQPTPTVNVATISINGFVLQRQAWVTLMPASPVTSDLFASFKSASPRLLGPSDTVTYSIHLQNSGKSAVTAQVVDPVPTALTYVDGSADNGGVYAAATKTITWTDVAVPSMASVVLTFAAKAPDVMPVVAGMRPLMIDNTASITSGGVTLKRSAFVLLVNHPVPPLQGSFKAASQKVVSPGDEFTYTINLNNSSSSAVTASVSDPLPAQVTYVDGSANAGGVYDAATRTLSWTDLSVPAGSTMALTFNVTAQTPATPGTRILNTASITSGGVTFKRSALVVEVPKPGGDVVPPVVKSFTIGAADVLTDPQVTLHTDATDNVGVTQMYLVEWALAATPSPHWQVVKTSGWVPYQADFPWTLGSQSGTHFMGVWVADAALNKSHLTRASIDFASLLQPATHVDKGGMVPYLVYYPAGVDVSATLSFTAGSAHLFVWHPGNMFDPDDVSPNPTGNSQTITFTTKTAGVYLFLVFGAQATDFDLTIAPPGGPRIPLPMVTAPMAAGTSQALTPASTTALDGITYNPILPQSGLDPLSVAADPPFFQAFVPLVVNH